MVTDNHNNVKTYGDHLNDGLMQLHFTLPIPYDKKAEKAAIMLALKMGVNEPDVVHSEELTYGYTFFIVIGKCSHSVDYSKIQLEASESNFLSREEVEQLIDSSLKEEVVVVGASTGTDIHTLGIDSILNQKGFDGNYGLERYKGFRVYNLGAQVPNDVLVSKALEVKAKAILVSQTVTQQGLHIHNLTELADMLESEGIRDDILLICGGPRISNQLAKELGYDIGFSKGCLPNHVATYIVKELLRRKEL